ncbi:hypothetical protein [Alkalihalobacterium bogoriense]|uniref:hypothetical protein n=1 Tax=Alkalihalobacterium bogoriense TaxID=246272 RepID=UPI00047DBEDE|nr:hypothetical protein [Alkalihalobacterium bogoriense]
MIKSKKQLILAIALFVIVIFVNIPFPHFHTTLGANLTLFNIPLNNKYGLNYIGIASVLVIIIGLIILHRSLEKYRVRLIILAFVLVSITPQLLVNVFQKTIATGIYAIEYNPGDSKCEFTTFNSDTLHGHCELWFQNHSNHEVTFTVEFYDYRMDRTKMVSLMNSEEPIEIIVEGKIKKPIIITKEIDVSNLDNYISSGTSSYVNIIMRDGNKYREL